MTFLAYPVYLDHIRTESARFREVLTDCDPAARVPACPDWDAADLVWHLAEVQWFWAATIRVRPASIEAAGVERPRRPDAYAELLERFDDFSRSLVAELEGADPAEPADHWSDDKTVGASYSRQAHEALIHRVDAEQTAGVEAMLVDPDLAADGVREVCELIKGGELPDWLSVQVLGGTVAVELADTGTSLRVRPTRVRGTDPESGTSYHQGHLLAVLDAVSAPAATVLGTAGDIDLWLWNRRADEGIDVSGDQATCRAFLDLVSDPVD